MKKIIIISSLCLLLFPFFASAKQWCCSRHKWVAYCASNGRYVCNDWTYSPTCTCWGSVNRNNYYKSSYYNNYKVTKKSYKPIYYYYK